MAYRHRREALTLDEQNSIANACTTPKERLVVWTLLDTGLRIEEFCGITPKDIDWARHKVMVRGKNVKANGSGEKKERWVPIPPRVRMLLEQWIGLHGGIGFGIRNAQLIVKSVAKRVRLYTCSPHSLRHSYACTALEKGVPINTLQELLGHEDVRTTAIYTKQSNSEACRILLEKW